MKLKKTFKTLNYISNFGDTYSRWTQTDKNVKDAVELTVTDETGKVVYHRVIRKGGMLTQTLEDCRFQLNNHFRVWKTMYPEVAV